MPFQRLMKVFAMLATGAVMSTMASASTVKAGPGQAELANATFTGLHGAAKSITLVDGRWEGEPWIEGGASVPSARLVGDLVVHADLNGDGVIESLNLISYSGGGTGHFVHLSVNRFNNGSVENVSNALLGDRVMVRGVRIQDEMILVDLVQAGPGDGACCPGDMITRAWALQPSGLGELPHSDEVRRLSPDILDGSEWRLSRWSPDEPVDEDIAISLAWADGRLMGRSACNRFFASVDSGQGAASALVVGAVGSTRMACIDEQRASAERRFLGALGKVNRMYFLAGDLVLYWGEGSEFGGLHFKRAMNEGN